MMRSVLLPESAACQHQTDQKQIFFQKVTETQSDESPIDVMLFLLFLILFTHFYLLFGVVCL